jgi:hypothetical protein
MASVDDHLGPASSKSALWNVTDLNTLKLVRKRGIKGKKITVHAIPTSLIPSPLAENITAQQIQAIQSTCRRWKPGGGDELWRAWKRAWDLWNNHYIPGRVNPMWVKEELARRQKERSKVNKRSGTDARSHVEELGKVHDHFLGDDPPPTPAGMGKKWVRGHPFNVPSVFAAHLDRDKSSGVSYWELVDIPEDVGPVPGRKRKRSVNRSGGKDDTQDIWWSNPGEDKEGNSGGLTALKSRAEYQGEGLEDKVANTVWRPLKVGGKKGNDGAREFDDWWMKVDQTEANEANIFGVRMAGSLKSMVVLIAEVVPTL